MGTQTAALPTARLLSHSEVTALQICQAKHDFQYVGQLAGSTLKPKVAAPVLRDGRAWGAAVAELHVSGSLMAAEDALLASLDTDAEAMLEAGVFLADEFEQERESMLQVLRHYERTAEALDGRHPETHLRVMIPSRTGKRKSNRYGLDAYIDLVHTDSADRDWIVEFKLRNQLTSAQVVTMSQQIRWYAWAWHEATGRSIAGVIVDERLKAAPKSPKINKDGKVSTDKRQLVEPHEYEAACTERGQEIDSDTLRAFQSRRWQQRVSVLFRPDEMAEVERELVSAAQQVRDFDNGTLYPLRVASDRVCRGCQFLDICPDPTDDELIGAQFNRRTPKRLIQTESEVAA